MARVSGPWGAVAWLSGYNAEKTLAGAAFLIGSDIVLTCAHVIRDHLGLPTPTPPEPPRGTAGETRGRSGGRPR
jgi:hypothetical protein